MKNARVESSLLVVVSSRAVVFRAHWSLTTSSLKYIEKLLKMTALSLRYDERLKEKNLVFNLNSTTTRFFNSNVLRKCGLHTCAFTYYVQMAIVITLSRSVRSGGLEARKCDRKCAHVDILSEHV